MITSYRTDEEYKTASDWVRLWLCRLLLRLVRWAYKPYPIDVILRRNDGIAVKEEKDD